MHESMAYDKSLLSYDLKLDRKTESSTIPNTECNGKNVGTVFQALIFSIAQRQATFHISCDS